MVQSPPTVAPPRPGRRHAAVGARRRVRSANSTGCSRSRSKVARTTSTSPAKSEPCTSCTFLPGRIVRRSMRSGVSGTGRISSSVNRAGKVAVPASNPSSCPASSADGAPPCCACGDHGPRASSVGTATSPSTSNTYSGSLTAGSVAGTRDRRPDRRTWQPTPEDPCRSVCVLRSLARAGDGRRRAGRARRAAPPAAGRRRPHAAPSPSSAPARCAARPTSPTSCSGVSGRAAIGGRRAADHRRPGPEGDRRAARRRRRRRRHPDRPTCRCSRCSTTTTTSPATRRPTPSPSASAT